jgi:hypothetical protein
MCIIKKKIYRIFDALPKSALEKLKRDTLKVKSQKKNLMKLNRTYEGNYSAYLPNPSFDVKKCLLPQNHIAINVFYPMMIISFTIIQK